MTPMLKAEQPVHLFHRLMNAGYTAGRPMSLLAARLVAAPSQACYDSVDLFSFCRPQVSAFEKPAYHFILRFEQAEAFPD